MLGVAVALAIYKFSGYDVGLHPAKGGSPLLASLACLVIAALFIYTWFAQRCVVFDTTSRELIIASRGYSQWHERRISLIGCREIYIRLSHGMRGKTKWPAYAKFADQHDQYLTEILNDSDVEPFAESLKASTGLPVIIYGEKQNA